MSGFTVHGPGLAWDEPAYRHSQVTLQHWGREIADKAWQGDWFGIGTLFSNAEIGRYWEYNRFGHNFHPPMASYLNLASYGLFGSILDDLSARRLAGAMQLALAAALLTFWVGKYTETMTGLAAGLICLSIPRLIGHSHLIGTDFPLFFFWVWTAYWTFEGCRTTQGQWLSAVGWACLCLVKATGILFLFPLAIWFGLAIFKPNGRHHGWRCLRWSLLIGLPLFPIAVVLLTRQSVPTGTSFWENSLFQFNKWMLEQQFWLRGGFLLPLVVYYLARYRIRQLPAERNWDRRLELPWVLLAVTPIVCLMLNPTWWHQPFSALADYVDLTLNRQGHLPDIRIFYLGQQYLYSLPWHNAWVLLAVTLPFGTLIFGFAGVLLACGTWSVGIWTKQPMPAHHEIEANKIRFALLLIPTELLGYWLLHLFTFPVFRMFNTPAHDGVRLFLPTFFFWAIFAALACRWCWSKLERSLQRRLTQIFLFLLVPGSAFYDWCQIHPYELSYYNVGLQQAVRWGLEPTYWYDAVTPKVVAELNQLLPPQAAVGFPSPLINPEVFHTLQQLGRLRPDLQLELQGDEGLPYYWLLTHSSKANAFTQLLFACKPVYAHSKDGVRLFSVVGPESAAVAWALWTLAVAKEREQGLTPIEIYEPIFHFTPEALTQALAIFRGEAPSGNNPKIDQLVAYWRERRQQPLQMLLQTKPTALSEAITILTSRPNDVRTVLQTTGYPLEKTFHGYLNN